MPVETPDLWPEELATVETTPPVLILRRQAAALGERTKYYLSGDVATDAFGETFIHRFNIVVPKLNHYTYELFAVRHDMSFYPLTCMFEGHEQQAKTEPEFINWLRDALASPHTKQIIGNLLAQADR